MASVNKLEICKDDAGEYRWRGRARNGEIVAESGEGYTEKRHAKRMARELHSGAVVFDLDKPVI